jgi:hypothetical protein
MELFTAIDLTNVVKWLGLVIGVLTLALEWFQKGDLSIGSIVTIVFAIVMFVINNLQAKTVKRLGLKRD